MYIMTGFSKKNNKAWFKLFVSNDDEKTKCWIFISESIKDALRSCGVKVYEHTTREVE